MRTYAFSRILLRLLANDDLAGIIKRKTLVFTRKSASDDRLSEHFDKLGVTGSSPVAPTRHKSFAEPSLRVASERQKCGTKPRIPRYCTAKLGRVVLHVPSAWNPVLPPPQAFWPSYRHSDGCARQPPGCLAWLVRHGRKPQGIRPRHRRMGGGRTMPARAGRSGVEPDPERAASLLLAICRGILRVPVGSRTR